MKSESPETEDADRYGQPNFHRCVRPQSSMKTKDQQMLSAENAEASTKVDPNSNKRSSDDSKNSSGGNGSSNEPAEESKEESKENSKENSSSNSPPEASKCLLPTSSVSYLWRGLRYCIRSYKLPYDELYHKSLSLDLNFYREY